ncbi:MAG: MFS transporter, partial [Bryobacteraceae bacterium]
GRIGIERVWWAALPGLLVTLLLLVCLRLHPAETVPKAKFDAAPLKAQWKQLTILYFLVFIRSISQVTFAQFLPLYFQRERGYSPATAAYIVSVYLTAGALGGFVGGNLADRFGGRRVIVASFLGSVPFLLLFVFTRGPLSIAGLILGGLILLFTIPVNVVMGQQLVPSQAGTISSLMMGFSWGMAGLIFIPLTGWVSDHFSMQTAFIGLVLMPAAGFFLSLKLKK